MFAAVCQFGVFAADEPVKESDADYEKAQEVLFVLGTKAFSEPEKPVTYAMFKDALYALLGGKDLYVDMNTLMGINFSSETASNEISFSDAAKALVTVAGYKPRAEINGGSTAVYVNTAQTAGMLTSVINRSGTLSSRDAAVMIYNTLNADMLQNEDNGTSVEYKTYEGESVLYFYRNIKRGKGIITANGFTGFYSESGRVSEGFVSVGTKLYKDESDSAADLIGYAAEFYYKVDKQNYDSIIYAAIDEPNNDITVIDENFARNSGRTVYYYSPSGSERSVTIPANAAILFNGVAKSGYTNDLFDFTNNTATLIDNNGDGQIEAVHIFHKTDWYVSRVDIEHTTIYDLIAEQETDVNLADKNRMRYIDVNSADHKRVRFFDESGKQVKLFNVQAGNVLSVYASENREIIDFYISTKQLSGTVDSIKTKKSGKTVKIGDGEYKVSKTFDENFAANLFSGATGTFFLNQSGELVYFSASESGMKYGYILGLSHDAERFETTAKVKLLSEDGRIYTYDFAKRTLIDGEMFKKATDIISALTGCKMVRYDVSEDGEVFTVDTPSRGAKETDDSLEALADTDFSSVNYMYEGSPKCFGNDDGGKIILRADTKVFVCPENATSDSDYGVYATGNIRAEVSMQINAYWSKKDIYTADAVALNISVNRMKNVNSNSAIYMVDTAENVLNDNGVQVMKLKLRKTTPVEYLCSEELVMRGTDTDIDTGDVIMIALSGTGEISEILKVFDCDTKKIVNKAYNYDINDDGSHSAWGVRYSATYKPIVGYVYYAKDGVIGVSESLTGANGGVPGRTELNYATVGDYSGAIIDSDYPEGDVRHIRRLYASEIKSYQTNGKRPFIFIRYSRGATNFVALYQ